MSEGTRRNVLKRCFSRLAMAVAPLRWKRLSELYYWKGVLKREGTLANDHFLHFYTSHFGLDEGFYRGKALLDIGCGPRGSLEWAHMATRRVGVDPLADRYLAMGAARHRMEYVRATAERLPLPDAAFDVVFAFNSLDHVEDVAAAVREIKRVTRVGGLFLLIVEVNHPPTDCEPHCVTPAITGDLAPEFRCEELRVFRITREGGYASILDGDEIPSPQRDTALGFMTARFRRVEAEGATP